MSVETRNGSPMEFDEQWLGEFNRRDLLKVMGASAALLGLTGCFHKEPQGEIVPYPNSPDQEIPGRPMFFATAMPFGGYGKGVLVLSREGRPIKIEGNPDHPASLGATDIFMQASVLDLYDPDRARTVRAAGEVQQWGQFYAELMARLDTKRHEGSGVRILSGPTTSPTLLAQIDEFTKQFPGARWHEFDPIGRADGNRAASAFQNPVDTLYDFADAAVVVSFDADFMSQHLASIRYARQFIDGRRVRADRMQMNRLYVIESTLSITGSMADHRLPVKPSQIQMLTAGLAQKLNVTLPGNAVSGSPSAEQSKWIDAVAADLTSQNGKLTLVIAGETQPPAVHAIVHLINQKLGNVGKTVLHVDPVRPANVGSFRELVTDMQGGKVDTLLMLGVNPAYSGPADIPFGEMLRTMSSKMENGKYANFTAALSTHYDETAYLCQWHIPKSHYLESWGDIRAFDGTASIIQPLIAPLFASKSDWELMEALLGRPDRTGSEIIREYWQREVGEKIDFEQWWVKTLQKGVIEGTAYPHRSPPTLREDVFANSSATTGDSVEILFHPDPNVWAGEFANNGWLQELPRPFTKLTWDNAVAISIRMARKLGAGREGGMLRDGNIVRINYRGREIAAPVILLPGQADDLITVYLGYGRSRGGNVMLHDDLPRGYNAYLLRTSDAPWFDGGAQVTTTDQSVILATTRNHHAMSTAPGVPGIKSSLKPEEIAHVGDSQTDLDITNRNIVRTATLQQLREDPAAIKNLASTESKKHVPLTLYPKVWDYEHGLQWGMSIDMTACIGCNACVIACQAENNSPVVGKEQVLAQREMHWIRIDDYFDGMIDSPTIHHQPVPCMQCENAPCEYVCPVGATTHSDEGINEMTYNRCVGTRYCSNNCPYKVRRFNFFLFSDYETPTLKLLHNPDVTVRSRGVMEKCNYCIQRIDHTRIEMEKQVLAIQEQGRAATDPAERDRLMNVANQRGLEIVRNLQTACQQSCPTRAIIFGNIRDTASEIAQLKKEPTDYTLLDELTTKPRTSYLAHIQNPNPALGEGKTA